MSNETTKIPSALGALIKMLSEGQDNPMKSAIESISASLTAAGVVFSGAPSIGSALGALPLDNKLPLVVAAAQSVEGGRYNS